MRNVIVTGAGGFIGSHLAELCVESGFNVKAFIRYRSSSDWGWLETSQYKNDMEVIAGDIRDFDSVSQAIRGADTVYHLAALIGIPYSYVSPLAYIRTNVEGTYNVLEAARKGQVENVLITSTSETYGTAQYVPIDEKHPNVGQSPYSATKIAADALAVSYYRSFNLPVKLVRPFNTYGPRQSARAIIPTIITQIAAGKKRITLGNLMPTRDLTFVKDTAQGFLEIAKSDSLLGEVTNIGMQEEISMGDLTRLIGQLMNENIDVVSEPGRIRPDNSEVERLICDNTKLKRQTEWKAQFNLKTGLQDSIKWFQQNLAGYKIDAYNI